MISAPPRFDIAEEKQTVNVLEPNALELELPIFGVPVPTVEWFRCGGEDPLTNDERVKILSTNCVAKLKIPITNRKLDSGIYKAVLSNNQGKTECEFLVSVYGKYI